MSSSPASRRRRPQYLANIAASQQQQQSKLNLPNSMQVNEQQALESDELGRHLLASMSAATLEEEEEALCYEKKNNHHLLGGRKCCYCSKCCFKLSQSRKARILSRRYCFKRPLTLPIGHCLLLIMMLWCSASNHISSNQHSVSALKFDPTTNSYSGLTFTFDPRLDKQVQERLHFEHWLAIMQHTSSLLHDSLNGRAHLAEVRVLIPYKWRQIGATWPLLHKPGAPIIANRRLKFSEADVLVGHEDPIYKETPFAVQHDECGRPGLNIRMPIGFLDQQTSRAGSSSSGGQLEDVRLKARQLVREFAAHRFGIFKESGFRSDFMYPPYSSVAGLPATNASERQLAEPARNSRLQQATTGNATSTSSAYQQGQFVRGQLRGFNELLEECNFETSSSSGLPASEQASRCLPYLVSAPSAPISLNLMSADPFSYASGGGDQQLQASSGATSGDNANKPVRPIHWSEQLAELVSWHFCGENFAPVATTMTQASGAQTSTSNQVQQEAARKQQPPTHFEHNERASNKQNKMCQERSALDIIRASDDFRRAPLSPSNFNRLPAPNFRFLQEMPPRLIMCFEYTSHLFQTRRLDHGMLAAAVNKLLAFDLIADSELATIVFGQHQARSLADSFQRLETSLSSRFALFNPAIDPFDEQPLAYTSSELIQMGVTSGALGGGAEPSGAAGSQARILKGTCSFGRLMNEVNQLLAKSALQYDDADADLVVLTSGLFVEDEQKIEEIIRASSQLKLLDGKHKLQLIIYPSSELFDTKSLHNHYIVLDSHESELIIKARLAKLALIERLTGAQVHLVREQLDAQGELKMSTLIQFYQIFEHLARGHSWDQTNSMLLLASQQVDSRQQQATSNVAFPTDQIQQQQHKLTFQFELDNSIHNELIVGFIDPKVSANNNHHHQKHNNNLVAGSTSSKAGKRFQLRNLQLISPDGQLVFTETGTHWLPRLLNQTGERLLSSNHNDERDVQSVDMLQSQLSSSDSPVGASAFFPYRAQLSLAAFHLRQAHLRDLPSAQLTGTWTLSALSDEPLQTAGLAMARTSASGQTLAASCWIQTHSLDAAESTTAASSNTKQVKVFVQLMGDGGREAGAQARLEVQDEMGNIVQNVQMLDDGLGAPDMTQSDGILTQLVQRAHRPGLYKVQVEVALPLHNNLNGARPMDSFVEPRGQDNVCCGSSMAGGSTHQQQPPVTTSSSGSGNRRRQTATRQLYCGTFRVDAQSRLAPMRPPRIANLTAVQVDQENRRVTLRWFEPAVEIHASTGAPLDNLVVNPNAPLLRGNHDQLIPISSEHDLLSEETLRLEARRQRTSRSESEELDSGELLGDTPGGQLQNVRLDNVLVASHQQERAAAVEQRLPAGHQRNQQQQAAARYEIKLFTDRDIIKRAFEAKQEIGFKFSEWNVEGQWPNVSQFGGMKEVTLRVPFAREGFYFIALKVYNNLGLASELSNIVQFYLRNNLTLEEVDAIYNQPGVTVDSEGNVYDKNGELLHHHLAGGTLNGAAGNALNSHSLLRGTSSLDGLSVLVLFSLLAFVMTIMCVTLIACLANSARQSVRKKGKSLMSAGSGGKCETGASTKTISALVTSSGGGGSGSSVVSQSSGCESSEVGVCSSQASYQNNQQQQQLASNSQLFHQDQLNAILQTTGDFSSQHCGAATTTYSHLQQQHEQQQQQAQLIHNQLISSYQQQQQLNDQHDFYNNAINYHQQNQDWQQQQQQQLQHTLVNGYTYATVMPAQSQTAANQQQQMHYAGDLNQAGLGPPATPSEFQQEQQRGVYERVGALNGKLAGGESMLCFNPVDLTSGLPACSEAAEVSPKTRQNYATVASQQQQLLQQQLSSVLKSKRKLQEAYDIDLARSSSSPALEGVTGEEVPQASGAAQRQPNHYHDSSGLDQMAAAVPPPPQYIYSPLMDSNGLQHQMLNCEPSIYSQVTSLQQVPATQNQPPAPPIEQNYYVNHYDSPSGTGATGGNPVHWQQAPNPIGSQQQQQGDRAAAISEV